jgi:hypothetical protein
LRKKAGQGINIECDTMQAAKIHRSKRWRQVIFIPPVKSRRYFYVWHIGGVE